MSGEWQFGDGDFGGSDMGGRAAFPKEVEYLHSPNQETANMTKSKTISKTSKSGKKATLVGGRKAAPKVAVKATARKAR